MALFGVFLAAAGLLVVAGMAKALRPGDTARAVVATAGGVPFRVAVPLVRGLAGLEAALGAAALAVPARPLAVAVSASYGAFAVFVALAWRRGGVLATCGCFGSPDTPPTRLHVVLDVLLAAAAAAVAWAGPGGTLATVLGRQELDGWPLIVAAAACGVLAYAVMAPLARLQASARALRDARR